MSRCRFRYSDKSTKISKIAFHPQRFISSTEEGTLPMTAWSRVSIGALAVVLWASLCASPTLAQKKKPKLPSQQFKGYGGLPEPVKVLPQNLPAVTSVQSSRQAECREVAAKIDALVEANLTKLGLQPNADADDHRRARTAPRGADGVHHEAARAQEAVHRQACARSVLETSAQRRLLSALLREARCNREPARGGMTIAARAGTAFNLASAQLRPTP